jgi:hypothetical protein
MKNIAMNSSAASRFRRLILPVFLAGAIPAVAQPEIIVDHVVQRPNGATVSSSGSSLNPCRR